MTARFTGLVIAELEDLGGRLITSSKRRISFSRAPLSYIDDYHNSNDTPIDADQLDTITFDFHPLHHSAPEEGLWIPIEMEFLGGVERLCKFYAEGMEKLREERKRSFEPVAATYDGRY